MQGILTLKEWAGAQGTPDLMRGTQRVPAAWYLLAALRGSSAVHYPGRAWLVFLTVARSLRSSTSTTTRSGIESTSGLDGGRKIGSNPAERDVVSAMLPAPARRPSSALSRTSASTRSTSLRLPFASRPN